MLKQAIPPIIDRQSFDAAHTLSVVPPLGNLPHWTRVNPLARTCPPKPLLKDRQQRLPPNANYSAPQAGSRFDQMMNNSNSNDDTLDDAEIMSTASEGASSRRAYYLEHAIAFLKQEHNEILSALHDEVDRLKRENRDLQFRLTLTEDRSLSDLAASRRTTNSRTVLRSQASGESLLGKSDELHVDATTMNATTKNETRKGSSQRPGSRASRAEAEQKDHGLEVEVLELRQALKDERHRNLLLEEQLHRSKSDDVPSTTYDAFESQARANLRAPKPPTQPRPPAADRPFRRPSAGLLQSGSIGDIPIQPANSPISSIGVSIVHKPIDASTVAAEASSRQLDSVEECREFIHSLQLENSRQADELHHLKSDLHDALYSHKWTPEAFLLAKAYLATSDTDQLAPAGSHPSTRVRLRPSLKKIPDSAYLPHDSLSLPPMKLVLGAKSLDRTKRTQQQQLLARHSRLDRNLLSSHDAAAGH